MIRLLDPPLHEFLPDKEVKIKELADDFKMTVEDLKTVISSLHEINPMLGHRGCRLGITHPEIYKMQVQAIAEAAMKVCRDGGKVNVEIEIPLVGTVREFTHMKKLVKGVLDSYGDDVNFEYKIGTMIEVPELAYGE